MKSVVLDLNRFLWNHYLIYDRENELDLCFFPLVSLKISIPPPFFFGMKGLSIILFVSLSTIRSFIHLIISAPLQGHYYYSYVAAEETGFLASDRAKTQVFRNSKPTFFTLRHSCLIPFHWNDRTYQF